MAAHLPPHPEARNHLEVVALHDHFGAKVVAWGYHFHAKVVG